MQNRSGYGLNRNGQSGITSANPALDIGEPSKEVRAMPDAATISPKGDSATQSETPPKTDKWQSVGSIAARLVAKAGAKK